MGLIRDRIAKAALFLGVFGAIVPPVAASVLSGSAGRTVILINADPPDVVEANRALWTLGEPVEKIYGTPLGEPMRILFADPARIIVPKEDPAVTLYSVDKTKGENPLQVQTVWYAVRLTMYVSGGLMALAFLLFLWRRLSGPHGAVSE